MTATETLVRARVKEVVEAEFTPEGFTVEDDKLGRSAGMDGRNRLATSPEAAEEDPRNVQMLVVPVTLQIYLAYDATPDSDIAVDPSVIEGYGGRLRSAFRTASSGATNDLWFLRLRRIDYPDDPTGNKSRLEALIEGRAENAASLPA